MSKRRAHQAQLGAFGFASQRAVRGTVQEVGGPQYHTGYDQWKAGKYPGQDRYANLHAFLCNQCSIRGFSNHQAASNRHLVALCKAFDALARADDEVAPHMRKPLSSLVKLAKTKADEMPLVESEAVPAPAPTQQAPALVADLAIARQVEVEMAADDNAERSAEALEAAIANERQRARGYTTTPVRNSNDCLYPSLHKHEVYAYVEAKLMAQYAGPVGLDAPAEPFPRASEMVHVPEDIQGDSRVMGMLRESHAWAKPTPEGLACRACFDASKRGVFVGRCLPWNEVKSRFTSRAKEHTEATRQKHTEKWAQWLAREDSVRRHGTAGEIRSTAHQRAWVNSKVKQLQNTEMLCRLLHDVQYCCSNNEALTTTLASLRVRDSYTSPEVKSFNATYHNLTSNTIYDEVVGLMASHAMAEVNHKIERSPFVSIITDETQDVTRQSQFCILIRVIDPTTFDTNELFWRMTPLNTSQTATNITDFLIQQLDDLGDGFWNKMLAFASDSCNTMGGSRKGVQLQVKVRKAPYSFWAACRAHALNLVAMHTAKDHPVIRASYDLVSSTFALLYRGAGNGTGKLRCFRECMSALERIDGFGFWRERDLCSVGDTRWCSHERCAQSLTDCLKGVVMCINKLDHEKAVALRAVYQESSTLVGLFLMREVMHCLGAFSRCIQHASLCFGDLPRIATHYACKIGKLLERPDLSPTYASCWILINDARPSCPPITEEFVAQYHEQYAKPYLRTLKEEIEGLMDDFGVLAAFSVYDPWCPDFDNAAAAAQKLKALCDHFCEPKVMTFEDADGVQKETEPSAPYFPAEERGLLELELANVRMKLKETAQTQEDTRSRRFSTLIKAFLKNQLNRLAFPHTSRLLQIVLTIPLSTSSAERMFSKLRIIKNRLSNRMGDAKLQNTLAICMEGSVTPDGIPEAALRQYVDAFTSEERKLSYCPFGELRAAQQHATAVRQSLAQPWWV